MTTSRKPFEIHVDSSCVTDPTGIQQSPSKGEEVGGEMEHDGLDKSTDYLLAQAKKSEEEVRKKLGDDKTEALIRAAAQDVLAKMELERAGYDVDSLLSVRTEEEDGSHNEEDISEVTQESGTEVSYTEGRGSELSRDDHTEMSYDQGGGTELSNGNGTEMTYGEDTEISYDDGSDMTYGEDTEVSYDDTEGGTEVTNDGGTEIADGGDFEHEAGASESGSGHTHRDNDDVFSQHDELSGSSRNSINSFEFHSKENDLATEEPFIENSQENEGTRGAEREQVRSEIKEETKEPMLTSPGSEISAMPPDEEPIYTPTKQSIYTRPSFRTPSSVRAIQMSSPTPSVINGSESPSALRAKSRASQKSTQSPRPSTSRAATPSSHTSTLKKKGTPALFKFKMETPLVLLHVTVLPLQFSYSSLLDSGEPLPESIQAVRDTWRLLQDKLGDVILNRGILLPHPQDSFEVLEEVLLDALELPARKRAEVLKCGHYLSASSPDLEAMMDDSSESEASYEDYDSDSMPDSSNRLANVTKRNRDKHVCPTCERTVKIDKSRKNAPKERRFRVKVYASNGLMGAGAWQAAWREMERVDVEIEPFVKEETVAELDNLLGLWTRHVEEMAKREEERFQQEQEEKLQREQEEQQQQQEAYERQYEQVHEQGLGYGSEPQVEHEEIQDFVQEESRTSQEELPEPVHEPESQSEEQFPDFHSENQATQELPMETPIKDAFEQTRAQTSPDEEHLLHKKKSIQRIREVYGDTPEADERIQSVHASAANSRPQSRQVHGRQSSVNNGQSSPIPAHALATRLNELHSASHSRSPERLRSRIHSSSASHSSGYGGMGMARHEILPRHSALPPFIAESDYAYEGNRPYSQDYAHNEEFIERREDHMRERLRRRTEKGSLPPRFGEGVTASQPPQDGLDRENSGVGARKAARSRESDSFFELLIAAFKVAMRDRKNVVILVLGILVLFFALRPTDTTTLSQSLWHNNNNNGNIQSPPPKMMAPNPSREYETRDLQDYDYDYEEEVEVENAPSKKPERRDDVPKKKPKSATGPAKQTPKSGKNVAAKKQVPLPKAQSAKAPESYKVAMSKPSTKPVNSQSRVKTQPARKEEVEQVVEVEVEPEAEDFIHHVEMEAEVEGVVHDAEAEDFIDHVEEEAEAVINDTEIVPNDKEAGEEEEEQIHEEEEVHILEPMNMVEEEEEQIQDEEEIPIPEPTNTIENEMEAENGPFDETNNTEMNVEFEDSVTEEVED